jgi:hypothetical protein
MRGSRADGEHSAAASRRATCRGGRVPTVFVDRSPYRNGRGGAGAEAGPRVPTRDDEPSGGSRRGDGRLASRQSLVERAAGGAHGGKTASKLGIT